MVSCLRCRTIFSFSKDNEKTRGIGAMKKMYLFLLLFSLFSFPSSAQDSVPRVERQIVFGVSPFDGRRFLSSFLPEFQKEMLLTANTDNPVMVLLSDVYYWPITAEYRADYQGVHIPLEGRLLIFRGRELYREFEQVEYIYVYPQGPAGETTHLLMGEEMIHFIEDIFESFDERVANPNIRWATFQGPFRGFVVNLSEGRYRMVFSVENEGQVFNMEKSLRVFSPIGRGAAYQIIPEEKWTVSSNSETSQQRIYLRPQSVIYLKIFPSILYSRADYERMAAPHRPSSGLGLENASLWIHEEIALEERGHNYLMIEAAGLSTKLRAQEFIVRQTDGTALGYNILAYDPELFPNTRPTFTAYRLTAPPPGVGVSLSIPGMEKETLRYLRCLEPRSLYLGILAFIFPLLVLLARFITGIREYRKIK